MDPNQADSHLTEENLLNFVVNALDEDIPLDLDCAVDVTPEELYSVLVGAAADGTSINHLCETTDDSPHANTVRGHLTDQFTIEEVEESGNLLLRRDMIDQLPDRPVDVVADIHLRPYYGDEAETDGLYHSAARAGTTAFHAYATLYAHVRNKQYTLAVHPVVAGETAGDVLAELSALLDTLDVRVKAGTG